MDYTFWQSVTLKWKELKNFCLWALSSDPSGLIESGMYYNTAANRAALRDDTKTQLLAHLEDTYKSAGMIKQPTITKGANSITVGNDAVIRCYKTTDYSGIIQEIVNPTGGIFALAQNVDQWLVYTYGAGYSIVSSIPTGPLSNIVPVFRYFNAFGVIHSSTQDELGKGAIEKTLVRIARTEYIERVGESGIELSTSGLNVIISGGYAYNASVIETIAPFDSATNNLYRVTFDDGVWSHTTLHALTNTQYNPSTGLATLNSNKYCWAYVWRSIGDDVEAFFQLGEKEYATEALAVADLGVMPANLYGLYVTHCVLVGYVLIKQGVTTTQYFSAWGKPAVAGAPVYHNTLAGIDAGDPGTAYFGHTKLIDNTRLNAAGAANGFALLGSDGKVPSGQLPPLLALGETSATAYRGDRGKIAYDHSQVANGNPHGTTAAQIPFTPTGGVLATNTQAAIAELDSEKLAASTAVTTYATIASVDGKVDEVAKGGALNYAAESTARWRGIALIDSVRKGNGGVAHIVVSTRFCHADIYLGFEGGESFILFKQASVLWEGTHRPVIHVKLEDYKLYVYMLDAYIETQVSVMRMEISSGSLATISTLSYDSTVEPATLPLTSLCNYTKIAFVNGLTSDAQTQLNSKQSLLTFDSTPTAGSSNPVKSDGIYNSIRDGGRVITEFASGNGGFLFLANLSLGFYTGAYSYGQAIIRIVFNGGNVSLYEYADILINASVIDGVFNGANATVINTSQGMIGRIMYVPSLWPQNNPSSKSLYLAVSAPQYTVVRATVIYSTSSFSIGGYSTGIACYDYALIDQSQYVATPDLNADDSRIVNASWVKDVAAPINATLTNEPAQDVLPTGTYAITAILQWFRNNLSQLFTSVAGKAQISHASTATTYGRSDATNYGHAMASSAAPLMDGTASAGTDNGKFTREGHVHPRDTSRLALGAGLSAGASVVVRGYSIGNSYAANTIYLEY